MTFVRSIWLAFAALVLALASVLSSFEGPTGGGGGITILPLAANSVESPQSGSRFTIDDVTTTGVSLSFAGAETLTTVAIYLPRMTSPASVLSVRGPVHLPGSELMLLYESGVRTFMVKLISANGTHVSLDMHFDTMDKLIATVR